MLSDEEQRFWGLQSAVSDKEVVFKSISSHELHSDTCTEAIVISVHYFQCCGAGARAGAARSRIFWSEPEP
jgi:hypothetical protein